MCYNEILAPAVNDKELALRLTFCLQVLWRHIYRWLHRRGGKREPHQPDPKVEEKFSVTGVGHIEPSSADLCSLDPQVQ